MSVSADMAAMWRRPARVVARLLARGEREDRALAYLLAGCLLLFLGNLPVLQRGAIAAGAAGDFERDTAYSLLGQMIILPLILYGIAAAGRGISMLFGLRTSGYASRLALFWAWLAAAPVALLHGLVRGLAGPGPGPLIIGALWIAALVTFWTIGLRVAGRETANA
ncbi:MAG: hypothetical protein IT542_01140 [Rubellimicrobium sp.]|nr:hypothetical protein [Rubellimicrobium sp.]